MTDRHAVFHDRDDDTYDDGAGDLTDFPSTGGAGATFGTPAVALGTTAAAGSVDEVIRRDSTIVAFDATVPATQAFGDSAATGSAAVAARRDHKHAMPAAPTAASVGADPAGSAAAAAAASVPLTLFDANTVLAADTDNTPAALTMGASTILARLAAGNIKAATPAELRTLLALVIGTNVEAWDADLDAIAALSPTNDDVIQRKAGAWTNRTMAQLGDDVLAPNFHAATGKTTPVDADELPVVDSAASNVLKKLTWANLKATLKTYFDTLYSATGAYAPGGTDVAVADGGTGASSAATARTNLGIAGAVGGVEWTSIVKGGDTSISSSTVLAADPDLAFTTVNQAVYEIEICLVYTSPVGAGTPDIKVGTGEDATTRGSMMPGGYITATEGPGAGTNILSERTTSVVLGTATGLRIFRAFCNFTGGGGSFAVMWAQNTSGSNATTVKAGSILRYRRIV